MSVWDDLVGQDRAVQVLQAAVASPGSGAHAWLFTGPPGSGRSVAARALAAALLCPDGGCGFCHHCHTAMSGTHADVTLLATEHVQIRRVDAMPLIQLAQRAPSGGRWRVIIVEDADRLNDTSANMLLKAIEEPPPRTVWILCAPAPDDVIPTIRSRCRHVGLRIPPVAAVAALLQRRDGVEPELAVFAARAAQSHVGLARRLARDEGARTRRSEVLALARTVQGVGDAVLAAADLVKVAAAESTSSTGDRDAAEKADLLRAMGAEGVTGPLPAPVRAQVRSLEEDQKRRATRAQRDVLDRALLDLLSLYRDVLVVQFGAQVELVNEEVAADVAALAQDSDAATTLRRMEAIGMARERIAANVAPLLAVEAMALALRPTAGRPVAS